MKKSQAAGLCLLILAFSLGLWFWLKDKATISEPAVLRVQTIAVKRAAMDETVETLGFLVAEQEAALTAGTSGRVAKIAVPAGSWVEKHTLLLTMLPTSEIRAPFNGYLSEWQIKEGETVREGSLFTSLLNTEALLVSYRLPEQYAGRIKKNQKLYLKSPDGQYKFTSQVDFVSPRIDRDTYTILLKARVNNPDKQLWPGMSLHIQHVLEHHPQALIIPDTALKPTMQGYEIYLIKEGRLKRQPVVIGETVASRVHIREGVDLNDQVVLVHSDAVREGAAVTAVNWLGDW